MRYLSVSDVWREKFGGKVYRLSIEGGVTCPNRDGTCGVGGCVFCAGGSGSFAENEGDVNAQLDLAKQRVAAKSKTDRFVAYFQSYTATYMPSEVLLERLMTAASREDIVAISVATRPDCLPDYVLAVLDRVNKVKPVTVELGLQTASDETARHINRGYATECYIEACDRLRAIGIEVVAHLIIGLPNETLDDLLNTVKLVGKTAQGVKLQLMHVLSGTKLCEWYEQGKYTPLSMEEYIALLCQCVEYLPPNVVIHRLTGDGDKKLLVAPLWSADKKKVLNAITRTFEEKNIMQGRRFKG